MRYLYSPLRWILESTQYFAGKRLAPKNKILRLFDEAKKTSSVKGIERYNMHLISVLADGKASPQSVQRLSERLSDASKRVESQGASGRLQKEVITFYNWMLTEIGESSALYLCDADSANILTALHLTTTGGKDPQRVSTTLSPSDAVLLIILLGETTAGISDYRSIQNRHFARENGNFDLTYHGSSSSTILQNFYSLHTPSQVDLVLAKLFTSLGI